MSQGDFGIKQLGVDDWRVFRDVRLAALQDAPDCLGDRYDHEKDGSEQQWRAFLQERTRFVALVEEDPVGMISVGEGEWSGTASITSVWVDPGFRRRRTGGFALAVSDALVVAALDWARDKGLPHVFLRLNQGCEAAERLYWRNGFRRTGSTRPLDDGRLEYEMALKFLAPGHQIGER
jgi:GNAT superfamily N-acetyltransferase